MLCITSPMPYLFYKWKLVHSDTLHPFCPLPTSASGNYQSVLCMYELGVLFGFLLFKIPQVSEVIWYLSFSV